MWFKVDDGFWCHPKVLSCPPAALALWVRAGSWSAAQLTDGRVPRSALAMLGGKPATAAALVTAGLWAVDGTDGWRFHGWEDYQPTRAAVEAERAASAARVAAWRAKRGKRRGGDDDAPPLAAVPDP